MYYTHTYKITSIVLIIAAAVNPFSMLATTTVQKTNNADFVASPRKCEPIRVNLCYGIGYNKTSMPNLVGHELQSDADFTLQTFSPLIQYGCSAQLHFFLCSAYLPMCTSKVPIPIGPCRGLCETVRTRCHPVLQGFGFPWPGTLDCSRFPMKNNHEHMCMEGPGEPGGGTPATSSSKTTYYYHGLQANCQGLAKSHLYIRINHKSAGSAAAGRCVPLCEADILFDQYEKYLAEMWVGAWSYSAFAIAIIAVMYLIFSEDTNSKWDKILTPLVICHSLVAVGWMIRFIVGRNSSACGFDPQLPNNISLLLVDGLSNPSCTSTFFLRYYFGMSSGVWWSILCLEWHRNVRRSRSNLRTNGENIFNNFSQLVAWGLPALQIGWVLVARLIDADELFGICYVGNHSTIALRILVATPLFSYCVFGAVNLFAGYLVYRNTSASIKQINVMRGFGKFLAIYCIPSVLLLIAIFYEIANTDAWLNLPQPTYEPISPVKTPMWPFMLRGFMELMLGVVTSAWVLGPRISTLCRNWSSCCKVDSSKNKHLPPSLSPPPPLSTSSTLKYTSVYSTTTYHQTAVCHPNVLSLNHHHRIHLQEFSRKKKHSSTLQVQRTKLKSSSSNRCLSLNGNETIL